jgi:competence protein ComEC
MKRFLLPLALIVAAVSVSLAATTAPATKAATAPASDDTKTVHTTKTGTKYHAAGCSYLSKSDITMTLKDAKAKGLTACSKCKP